MVKFLLLALALGVSCAQHQNLEVSPSEVDGKWHSLYIAADNKSKVSEGGPLRVYVKHLECSDECQTFTIKFYTKVENVCQEHRVVGRKGKDGKYITDFSGQNYFHVVEKADDTMTFHNVNVDDSGKTNVILVVGKGESSSIEQKQRFEKTAEKYDIPKENIEHLVTTDTCNQ
ncbi:male-specific submandibular salivary gland protein [Mesocricetus auratus]|uniref:Male-specific submandibular salivary gland protein n=2 Tax=Mesocricetus auratus TaxID=10036 RepID=MSP_MESAU|nr:male-specific submandibular salivary gland protein [Mesocricetus auratus]XP_040600104.1 male-specific submandibular salivary gland protein [Mesocricetus auratus]XP_040600105.1 male-specific submandibular salivary gland protein [Mesocricetus auratus]Q9QXU1.2 RecName: Full=Male-specific submandibular salivary gland protein; Flags: Precursor [Mesocricetus auratus]AAD55792.2 male-specific submandibular protein MSP precursor [Mesocricetus auratus]AAM00936.1 male-specific submandibular gland prot